MKFPKMFGTPKQCALCEMDHSRTTTVVPSLNTSHHNLEKESAGGSFKSPSLDGPLSTHPGSGEKNVQTTPVEEAEALDKLSDEGEYPSGSKLAIITLALCLSVFLVALVRLSQALLPDSGSLHTLEALRVRMLILW